MNPAVRPEPRSPRSLEKVGDHWEEKSGGAKGPSDARAARGGAPQRGGQTAGGVDAHASKTHLLEVAKRLEIRGRSSISKGELVEAIKSANELSTRRSRGGR